MALNWAGEMGPKSGRDWRCAAQATSGILAILLLMTLPVAANATRTRILLNDDGHVKQLATRPKRGVQRRELVEFRIEFVPGQLLVAVIESCGDDEVRIPFLVGPDASRTWVLKPTAEGLQLKHDHRHEDGTPDEVTLYGGVATDPGSPISQSFPADSYTANLIPEAASNEWFLSFSADGQELTYYLERYGKPRFKAVLSKAEYRSRLAGRLGIAKK